LKLSELALAFIVLTVAAVPLALLILFWTDILPTPQGLNVHRWRGYAIGALIFAALPAFMVRVWGWAGAAHLEPLCQAYSRPEILNSTVREVQRLDLQWITPEEGDADVASSDKNSFPRWAEALAVPVYFVSSNETARPEPVAQSEINESGHAERSARLEVRRIVHHRNLLFDVQLDRFRLVSADGFETWGIADELWLQAGPYRYHCGVESGPLVTADTKYPGGEGVARFVQRTLNGANTKP
jgi:hypothetical protein